VQRVLEEDPRGFEIYRQMNLFLNVFPEEFRRYQMRFLVPDPKRFDQVLGKLGFGEGERWWIHFEQHQDPGLAERIRAVVTDINDHLTALGQAQQNLAEILKTSVTKLEKSLSLSDAFPSREIVRVLAAHDVVFHVVFFRGDSVKESNVELASFMNLAALYAEAAEAAGGAAAFAGTEEQALTGIINHVDAYYDLAFLWAGPAEKARIQVLAGESPDGLRYAASLTRAQFEARARMFSPEKIRIDDISVAEGELRFVIKAYERGKENDFGLLKIRIQLLDDGNRIVFQEENTMRATKEAVSIAIPLPEKLGGASRLSITACDMLANRLTVEERPIDLKRPSPPVAP
jgi:hypothetical protein